MIKTYAVFSITIDDREGSITIVDRTGRRRKIKLAKYCARHINETLTGSNKNIIQQTAFK